MDKLNLIIRSEYKMKMDKVANSGNDEFYTPMYAIDPILKYIKSDFII